MAPIIQNLGTSPIGANWRQLAPILGQSPIGACAMIDSLFFNILVDESLPNISKTLIYRAWRGKRKMHGLSNFQI